MQVFLSVLLAMFVAMSSGLAQDSGTTCLIYGPPYQLASDTAVWTMSIGSGQSCIRGLRSSFVTLDSTKLVVPPRSGQVKLEGLGFVYRSNPDFRGEDSFTISVSGKLNKINGSSMIRVVVSVR